MSRTITATLTTYNSKADRAGNRYWAFQWFDHETGKVVCAKISGGESNINAIRAYWNNPQGWDDCIVCLSKELGIREFAKLTKDWTYAGCNPEDLAKFIRNSLAAA